MTGITSEDEFSEEKEILKLYHEVLDSLEEGTSVYLIDDYLSELENLVRNPTRSGDNAIYFTRRGLSRHSLMYLLKIHAGYPDSRSPEKMTTACGYDSSRYLTAEQLVSAAYAMKLVSANPRGEPTFGVSIILFERTGKGQCHEYVSARSLNETIMCNMSSADPKNHIIIIEPTSLRVCNVQKGCLTFKLAIKGIPHDPSFAWLGDTAWDALSRFQKSVDDFIMPRHAIYPVEFGKAPAATTSNFLIGYPTMATEQVRSDERSTDGDRCSVESYHYVSLPPNFSHQELLKKLNATAKDVEKSSGCQLSIDEICSEESFREDPHSLVVEAICNAVVKTSGFEPIFEWLPFPVSAKELKVSHFASDVVAFGPGDWAPANTPNERGIVTEILQASRILARVPYEMAAFEEKH